MKFLTLIALLATSSAFASGFKCYAPEFDTSVKVFNHTQPELGTHNAAIMVISDEAIAQGRKTIASFKDVKNTLSNSAATYYAKVDLRVSESNRKGENVFGTKLGLIDSIKLVVDMSYAAPLAAGEITDGKIVVYKRNGDLKRIAVECERYLKN